MHLVLRQQDTLSRHGPLSISPLYNRYCYSAVYNFTQVIQPKSVTTIGNIS